MRGKSVETHAITSIRWCIIRFRSRNSLFSVDFGDHASFDYNRDLADLLASGRLVGNVLNLRLQILRIVP